jgi:Protein of unknown function (DUF1264)
MHQCLLYDSTEKNARLLGVEYIISDRLYRELPEVEKKYWHPQSIEHPGRQWTDAGEDKPTRRR